MRRKKLLIILILLLATGCLQPEVRIGEDQPTPIAQQTTPIVRPKDTPQPRITEPAKPSIYLVQPGDTLSEIAAEHGTTVAEIVALNSDRYPSLLTNPSLIRIGWELRLPSAPSQMPEATSSPQLRGTPQPTVEIFDANEAEEQIVSLVNQARAREGLGLLAIDAALTEIARQRSEDMIEREYFSHYDPQTGEALAKKLLDQRGYTTAAENISLVQNETGFVPAYLVVAARYDAHEIAQRFVEGWLESPEHRENILRPDFGKTGVGIAVSSDGKRIVATQIFLGE